jgi:hypothetical protein
MSKTRVLIFCMVVWSGFSCTSSRKITSGDTGTIHELKFVNEYVVPYAMPFKATVVGGLSGIDRDIKRDLYYLIADDRSEKSPAHFYTAKILLSEKGIDSVSFIDAITLLAQDGKPYPNRRTDSLRTPDPEAIRYNPFKDELVWASEGDRVVNATRRILVDPAITIIDPSGRYKSTFELPANLKMQAISKGPRLNGVFEGISFSDDYNYLFASVEEPLYEDGPRAGIGDSSTWVRILKFDTRTNKQVAQYAYRIEPVAFIPDPPGGFKINGISEILYAGNNQLLVMERSFSQGRTNNTIRVFLADISNADDISSVESLLTSPPSRPITKKLLLNMDTLGRYIDNIEGITFGPVLPNGHRTLIFMADDNFSDDEKTQFFLFEIW